jgi:hypothetical protein
LANKAVIALLKEKFGCVQEVIPGAKTKPEDLPAERRNLLERFAHNDRFFFGTIRILSPDGKNVLAELRSFPGADEETRKKDGAKFIELANDVLAGKAIQASGQHGPPRFGFKKDGPAFKKESGPPFKKDGFPGFGPKKSGPLIGDQAPDFELKFLDPKETFKLSDNFDIRPTVLIFHSST